MQFFSLALLVAGANAAALNVRGGGGDWGKTCVPVTSYVTDTVTTTAYQTDYVTVKEYKTVVNTVTDTATVTTTEYKPVYKTETITDTATTTNTAYITPAPIKEYVTVTAPCSKTWADWS
ncbi:uncharacterized protein Z518_07513 [Rhinocladiella mackenziei CBS 650.93]|uniref:Uncharacterized protein n=1 Tax=Rhinocladiella mackenziei CBS 650.93 TaxID=1442369 RepID=A0A0D2J4P1_9EURO|nr:uncharacterized protein Z518_07513 [Rhinocladiella mackenziei CBS 650.93]KIX03960.1 hypothetical protein Z518_07513 [Rhinocladiella mackenziei CBS 650.93]